MILDQSTRRALHLATRRRYGHKGPRMDRYEVFHSRLVIRATKHLRYGYATDPRGQYTKRSHVVADVYTAWLRGRLLGWIIRWECGGSSVGAALASGTDRHPICWGCMAALARRSTPALGGAA